MRAAIMMFGLVAALLSAGCAQAVRQAADAPPSGYPDSDLPLFQPMDPGVVWEYHIVNERQERVGTSLEEVEDYTPSAQAGAPAVATIKVIFDPELGVSEFSRRTVMRFHDRTMSLSEGQRQAHPFLSVPLQVGTRWAQTPGGQDKSTITGIEDICTPYGRFNGVLVVEERTAAADGSGRVTVGKRWYAKGVGMVQAMSGVEATPGVFTKHVLMGYTNPALDETYTPTPCTD